MRNISKKNKMPGISERKEILNAIGGLPVPEMVNKGWLYVLKEETRNSLLIEGVFVSEPELEEVLSKGQPTKKSQTEALNYYRAAKYFYELAFQGLQTGEFMFSLAMIRQINKMLSEGTGGNGGRLRKDGITIAGAKISPPDGLDIEEWLKVHRQFVMDHKDEPTDKGIIHHIAAQHILFESIHPFSGGNGRTGRIIINYLLVSRGLPPVIMKGDDVSRDRYYHALERGDAALRHVAINFPGSRKALDIISRIDTGPMEELITEASRTSLDRMIINILETKHGLKLKSSRDVAQVLGYAHDSMRTFISRGKFIAIKRGKDWFTHETLELGALLRSYSSPDKPPAPRA